MDGHEKRETMVKASNRLYRIVGPGVGISSREEDVHNIVDIFLRPSNRNAILIGETTADATAAVKDLATRIKNGNVPVQLQGLQFLDPQLSSSSFGYCSSLEMEQKLAELSKIVEECMPAGAILHIGDLQWLAEPMQLKKGPSNFCPAQRTASELRQLLIRHTNNRLWFVGVATPQIFSRLQALYPSLKAEWGLQPVQITAALQPILSNRFANDCQQANDIAAITGHSYRGRPPMVLPVERDSRFVPKDDLGGRLQCCSDCLARFEEERRLIHDHENLSLQLAPAEWSSLTSDGVSSGGANGGMSRTCQVKTQSVVKKLAQLVQKWQNTCRTLHGQLPAQVLIQSRPQSSPLRRMSALPHNKPCGLGLDLDFSSPWSCPEKRVFGASVVDQPVPILSNLPEYTLSTSRQGVGSPPASVVQVQDAGSMGASKSSEAPCGGDLGSPKDGSSVASGPDDHEDLHGSTGTSARDACMAHLHTDLALGRAANNACFGSIAGKPRVQLPVTQTTPPQPVGASPISLRNSGKPHWLLQSSLQDRLRDSTGVNNIPQREVPLQLSSSPLVTSQARILKSPSPPPALKESQRRLPWQYSSSLMANHRTRLSKSPSPPPASKESVADSLKGLYKGLMQRVPWQGGAVAAIAATVMKCRSGMGVSRGATAKRDAWLLLLGPDRVAKHALAKALAELVFGGERSLLRLGLSEGSPAKLEGDDNSFRYRGRTPLDRLAEAVRLKPSSVILLEDVDKANNVMRASIVRAMERGKLADSNGREVSFSNTIVVMTTNIGSESSEPLEQSGRIFFSEGKLAAMGRCGIRANIKGAGSEKVVFKGRHNKILVVDHGVGQFSESLERNCPKSDVPYWVLKRKSGSLLQNELRPNLDGKRTKSGNGRFLDLDLNLATGESKVDSWPCQTQSNWVDDHSDMDVNDNEARREKVLSRAREALSDKYCALLDCAVMFDSYDFNGLANEVLHKLGRSFEDLLPCEVGVEIHLPLLEHITACVWKLPGGQQVFNTWVDDVFSKSIARALMDIRICGGSVVELVDEPELPGVKDAFEGVALPHSIVISSTFAV